MLLFKHKVLNSTLSSVVLVAFLLMAKFSANAGPLLINYGNTFSSTATPVGPAPWLSAEFTDVSAGTVQLTLSGSGLSGSEYVSCWYFNLAGSLSPSDLNFSETTQTGAFAAPTANTGLDSFKADGSGKYDILFSFASGNSSQEFIAGDSITFDITGIAGLDAQDFNALSAKSAGTSPLLSAARIQSISGTSSAWVAGIDPPVSDASDALVLLGIGWTLVEVARRKFSVRTQ